MNFNKNAVAAGVAAACVWVGSDATAASTTVTIAAAVAATCSIEGASTSSIDFLTLNPAAATTKTSTVSVMYKCTKGTTPNLLPATASSTMSITNGTDNIPVTVARSAAVAGSGTGNAAANTKTITVTVTLAEADAADVSVGSYSGNLVIDVSP